MDIIRVLENFKSSLEPKLIKEGKDSFKRFRSENDFNFTIDYITKESLSSKLIHVGLTFPPLKIEDNTYEEISENICNSITYLSERFKLIELDRQNMKMQIRSHPPYQKELLLNYFELLIDFRHNSLLLQRNAHHRKQRTIETIPFVLSYDILERLLTDLTTICR